MSAESPGTRRPKVSAGSPGTQSLRNWAPSRGPGCGRAARGRGRAGRAPTGSVPPARPRRRAAAPRRAPTRRRPPWPWPRPRAAARRTRRRRPAPPGRRPSAAPRRRPSPAGTATSSSLRPPPARGQLGPRGDPEVGQVLVADRARWQGHVPPPSGPVGEQVGQRRALGDVAVPDQVDQPPSRLDLPVVVGDRVGQRVAAGADVVGQRVVEGRETSPGSAPARRRRPARPRTRRSAVRNRQHRPPVEERRRRRRPRPPGQAVAGAVVGEGHLHSVGGCLDPGGLGFEVVVGTGRARRREGSVP
jgi:hypothetical protein